MKASRKTLMDKGRHETDSEKSDKTSIMPATGRGRNEPER